MIQRIEKLNILSVNALIMNVLYIPFLYFVSVHGVQLITLCFFMLIDFIFGIAKSVRLNIKVTTSKMTLGLLIKLLTLILPFLLFYFANAVGDFDKQLNIIIPGILILFIAVELHSIIGNFYTLKTGKLLEDIDLISFIFLKLREKIVNAIKGFLK